MFCDTDTFDKFFHLLFFLLFFLLAFRPCPFLLSLSLSLLSSISEFWTLSGSLLLSLVLVSSFMMPPVTADMLVMLDLENNRSFSLNLRFLLSGPTLDFVAVRYLRQARNNLEELPGWRTRISTAKIIRGWEWHGQLVRALTNI